MRSEDSSTSRFFSLSETPPIVIMAKSPRRRKKNAARLATNDVLIVKTVSIISTILTAKISETHFFGAHASANLAYFAASAAFFSVFDIVARLA